MKRIVIPIFILLLIIIISCNRQEEVSRHYEPLRHYENQIGDTHFIKHVDDPHFKFCDSTDVLHKRAFVGYKRGGMRAIYEDIYDNYVYQKTYATFSGYLIVRFAVNCHDESGRFRLQTVDLDFNLSEPPKALSQHIISIVKSLKGWKHPLYDNKDYDGYKFLTIKVQNGQIQKL